MKRIILFTVLFSAHHSFAQESLQQQLEQCKKASRCTFEINVETSDTQLKIPAIYIKGNKKGPLLTVIAGIHGFEYPPILAATQFANEIDPKKLSGSLLVIPMANPAAFYGRTPFLNPIDQKNLNTVFPGDDKGSISEQIAHMISKEVIPISDYFIDLHGGDAPEDLLPFACYYRNEGFPEKTAEAKRLSYSSGFPHVVSYPYQLQDNEPAKFAFKEASQQGVVALSLEAGRLGMAENQAVAQLKTGLQRILWELDSYPKAEGTVLFEPMITHLENQAYLKSTKQGLFFPLIKAGDKVNKDQAIGYIKDIYGKMQEELFAPATGIVLYHLATPPVNIDETIICIGY